MTVTTLAVQKVYLGDDATVAFDIPFQFWETSDIVVYERVSATGVVTGPLATPSQYSVSLPAPGGLGTLTMVTATPSGSTLHIVRVSDQDQQVDLTPAVGFPTVSVEEVMDRDVLRIQEATDAVLSRALLAPVTDMDSTGAFPPMTLPDKAARGVANAVLGFNASSEPIILAGVTLPSVTVTTWGAGLIAAANAAAGKAYLTYVSNNTAMDRLGAGLLGSIPLPTAYGLGLYYATDQRMLYYADPVLATWTQIGTLPVPNASLPTSSFVSGRLYIDTDNDEMLRDDGVSLVPLQQPWCRGSFGGGKLIVETGASISLDPCEARAVLGAVGGRNLTLTANMEKLLSVAPDTWVAGDGNNGCAPGVQQAVNTWYHLFMIGNLAGDVDLAIDTSKVGTNILAAGNIKTAGYDKFMRRVGSFYANSAGGGTLVLANNNGEHFEWGDATVESYVNTGVDFTAGPVSVVLDNAPPNTLVHYRAVFQGWATGGNDLGLIGDVQHVATPSLTVGPLYNLDQATDVYFEGWARTNSSKAIAVELDSTDVLVNLTVVVLGWVDDRDRYV